MRVSGFYWVTLDTDEQVAYWSDMFDGWYVTGSDQELSDLDMNKIDERRIVREVE